MQRTDSFREGIGHTTSVGALYLTTANPMVADNTGGWLVRVRSTAGLGHVYSVGVFIAGLLLIVLGFALVLVPGPFTIPPVLLGLWIWSTEFAFAQRLFQSVKLRGSNAWERVEIHPVAWTLVVLGGLATNGVAAWALVY